jgi:thiol-disulfide isomerase/thioredoxin
MGIYGECGRERKLSRTKPRRFKVTKPEKSTRRGILVFVAIIIVVLAVGGYVISQPPQQPGNMGDIAPDFTLHVVAPTGLSDQSVTLSSLRGKVVVLEFMASWCHVCQQMASPLEYLNVEYQGQDVVFLSVATSQNGATPESTAEFIKQYNSTWTYVFDTDNSVFSTYKIEATPTILILDRSGTILSRTQGLVATAALSDAIDRALS